MDAIDPRPFVFVLGGGVLLLENIVLGFTPGLWIPVGIVEDLAETKGFISPIFEKLGK